MELAGLFRTEGIVLRNRDYREADELLTILTTGYGKIEAIVKGTRKPGSRLRSGTQRLCRSVFLLYAGKNLATVTQCEVCSIYAPLRQDLRLLAYAYYLMEIADAVVLPGQSSPGVYKLLKQGLELLIDTDAEVVARAVEARILKNLGLEPCLERCSVCQRPVTPHAGTILSPAAGGIVCLDCRGENEREYSAAPGSIMTWRQLNRIHWQNIGRLQISPAIGKELAQIIPAFLEYYIDKKLRSRAFITEIGGN